MDRNAEDKIRLIFGLKLAQARSALGYSLSELSKKSKLSASYLNEIEKGKKYPKAEKIVGLAKALEIDYDELVSTKLKADLAPLGQLLSSPFFEQIPFSLFGLEAGQIVDLLAKSPAQASAFVGAFMDLARNYRIPESEFYLSALRSYQEISNTYFSNIEVSAEKFIADFDFDPSKAKAGLLLEEILVSRYGYRIDKSALDENPLLKGVKSYYKHAVKPVFYLESGLSQQQQIFLLAKEVGFNYLDLDRKNRVNTVAGKVQVESFAQLLTNFHASYFAGAILLPKRDLEKNLEEFFNQPELKPDFLVDLAEKWRCTPETLIHRLTNILPQSFGLDVLFFLKFNGEDNKEPFLDRELHLNRKHLPHANRMGAHYCARWSSLKVLKQALQRNDKEILAHAQVSEYGDSKDQYLVLSMARRVSEDPFTCTSACIGIHINPKSKRRIKSLENPKNEKVLVNVLCESCAEPKCLERRAPSVILEKRSYRESVKQELAKLH